MRSVWIRISAWRTRERSSCLQQEVLGQLLEDAYAGKFVPDDVPTSRENRDSGAMIPEEA